MMRFLLCRKRLPLKFAALFAWLVATFFLGPTFHACAADPQASYLSLHPDNPHYFLWRDQPTVLVTSGEHYGAVLNEDFDYVRYLDELQRSGLNHTRVFSGAYRENGGSFQITENTLAPQAGRYLCPWKRSDQPGFRDGGNRFDLNQWNEDYFHRLKDFVSQAGKRGIIVELTLFCPMYDDGVWDVCPMNASNNINDVGKCTSTEVYSLAHDDLTKVQLAVTQKIVDELRDCDNLYYEVCNEPYFGGVTMPWQHKIVDAIVEAESSFTKRHLISLNIANGREKVEHPHPAVSIFNFHYCVPPDTVAMNYGLDKAIGENETGFRGSEDVLYRTEGWDFMMAGGALYNNLDYSFSAKHPDGSLTGYQSPGGGSVALRDQLGILKQFFDTMDFVKMKPDNAALKSVSPELTTSVLSESGRTYAVYMHAPLSGNPAELQQLLRNDNAANIVLDIPAGQYTVKWLDTLTGNFEKTESIAHEGGAITLSSPTFAVDIALLVTRSE